MLISVVFWLSYLPIFILAQDYYKILGLKKNANDKEIKSAYRQLSKKWHPDKNNGDEVAHTKFIEVGEAYEVLSDPEKRQVFDKYGAEALKNGGGPGGHGGQFHDPFDIFEQMFGGGGGGRGRQPQRKRGPNAAAIHQVSLKDFYQGYSRELGLLLNDFCDHCHGSGSEDGKVTQCPDCQGHGVRIQVIQMGIMTQQIQQMCNRCHGSGEIIKNPCKTCKGNKVMKKNKKFQIVLPRGAPRKYTEIRQGEAEKGADFDAGDLYIEFQETNTNNMGYMRRGNNLYRTEVLTLKESLLGNWERSIEFLDSNKTVIVKRDANKIVYDGEIERIPHFGMPIYKKDETEHIQDDDLLDFGDLYITYVIMGPDHLSSKNTIRDEL